MPREVRHPLGEEVARQTYLDAYGVLTDQLKDFAILRGSKAVPYAGRSASFDGPTDVLGPAGLAGVNGHAKAILAARDKDDSLPLLIERMPLISSEIDSDQPGIVALRPQRV